MRRWSFVFFIIVSVLSLPTYIFPANYYDSNEKLTVVHGKVRLGLSKQASKDQAIKDAFATSLTKRIQQLISQEKFELHFELLNENIFNKAAQFIKRFVIKKQGVENEHYEVEIHLSIDELKVRKALASVGLLFSGKDYYRGLLLLSIKTQSDPAPEFWWGKRELSSHTKEALKDVLNKREITDPILLVDPFDLGLQDKFPRNLKKAHLSESELQALGKILAVDVIFYGSISIHRVQTPQKIKYLQLSSSIQSINVKTGRIISRTSFSGKGTIPEKDVKVHESKLIMKAATENLRKSLKNIINTWVEGTYDSTSYKIVLRGLLSYSDFTRIKFFLKNDIQSINSIEDYMLSKSKKVLNIESSRSLPEVSEEIKATRIENFQLEVSPTDNSGETLEILVKRF